MSSALDNGYQYSQIPLHTAILAHCLAKVSHVVVDAGDVPLIGALRVLIARAFSQDIGRVLVIFSSMVSKAFMHRSVNNHIFMVGVTSALFAKLGICPICEFCIPMHSKQLKSSKQSITEQNI